MKIEFIGCDDGRLYRRNEIFKASAPHELLQRVYAETENGWHVKPLTRHDIKAWLDCIDAIDISLEYVAGSTK